MNKDDFYLNHALGGFYSGRTLIQASGKIGGHRSVFVNIVGNGKNALTYPTFGGILVNPFKGRAKIYAGDVFEFDPGLEGNKGATVKILKYYFLRMILYLQNVGVTAIFTKLLLVV